MGTRGEQHSQPRPSAHNRLLEVGGIAIRTRAYLVRGAAQRLRQEWELGQQGRARGPKPCVHRASSVYRHVMIQRPPHTGRSSHRNHPRGALRLPRSSASGRRTARRVRLPQSASLLLHLFHHRSTTTTMKTATHARPAPAGRARTRGARARARRTGTGSTPRRTSTALRLRTHARAPSLPCVVPARVGGTARTSRRTPSIRLRSFRCPYLHPRMPMGLGTPCATRSLRSSRSMRLPRSIRHRCDRSVEPEPSSPSVSAGATLDVHVVCLRAV